VALQGTLDTFALPDVLRLLASTKKSGRLRVSGGRGTGSVWVDDGGVVGAEASGAHNAPTAVEVLFELLRYKDGSFTFEAGSPAPDPTRPTDVDPLLIQAEGLLAEWQDIEAVVPSLDSWVSLSPELPRADVVIDADRWRIVVAVGSGTSVSRLADTLSLSEVPVCRAVKDLVELGLGAVGAPMVGAGAIAGLPTPARAELDALASSLGADHEVVGDEMGDGLPPLNGFARATDLSAPLVVDEPGAPEPVDAAVEAVLPHLSAPAVSPSPRFDFTDEDEVDDDEVARQLANLSPQAARAVAAAAQAATEEERDAALAQVKGEDDEPINRGLLLKFLSSVRS
jgi:hypothetical protein